LIIFTYFIDCRVSFFAIFAFIFASFSPTPPPRFRAFRLRFLVLPPFFRRFQLFVSMPVLSAALLFALFSAFPLKA